MQHWQRIFSWLFRTARYKCSNVIPKIQRLEREKMAEISIAVFLFLDNSTIENFIGTTVTWEWSGLDARKAMKYSDYSKLEMLLHVWGVRSPGHWGTRGPRYKDFNRICNFVLTEATFSLFRTSPCNLNSSQRTKIKDENGSNLI